MYWHLEKTAYETVCTNSITSTNGIQENYINLTNSYAAECEIKQVVK